VGIDLCISQNIVFIVQALRRRAFFRRISHQIASGPPTIKLPGTFGRDFCEQSQMRNLAVVREGPEDGFSGCIMKYRTKWAAIWNGDFHARKSCSASVGGKGASGDDAGLAFRRNSISHAQAFTGMIGCTQVSAAVDFNWAVHAEMA